MKMRSIFIAAIFALLQYLSHASIPDTIQLGQIEVKAQIQKSIGKLRNEKIDSMVLSSYKTQSLSELVQQNSNVFLKSNGPGGLSTASFRGTTANHTLVLWNGFPINGPQLGQVDFSVIPVFFMDYVSLSVGNVGIQRPSGIGGVVMVDNVANFNSNLRIEAVQSFGSFGSYGTYASLAYGNARISAKSRFFRKSSRNDFTYENTAVWPKRNMKQQNASYLDEGLQQEVHLQFKKSVLSFVSWNQWNAHNLPPIMTNLERGGDPKEHQNDFFSRNYLSFKRFWENGKLEVKSSYFIEDQHYYLKTTSSIPPYDIVSLIDSHNKSQSWMNSFAVLQKIGIVNFAASLQYDHEFVESGNYNSLEDRQRLGVHVSGDMQLLPSLHLQIQSRYDHVAESKSGISPFVELEYQPSSNKNLVFSLSGGKTLRFPTMNDLHWYPGGNNSLVPEQALSANLAAEWRVSTDLFSSRSKIAFYASDIQDWIQWRPTSFRYWVPENVARVFARGLEFQQHFNIDLDKVNVSLRAHYAYTKTTDESPVAQIDNYSGRQLIYIPRHHGNLLLQVKHNKLYLNAGLELIGQRRTSYNDDQEWFDYLPSYQLLNISSGYHFRDFELGFKINNLFDKSYQAVMWRPMPGRNYECVISYRFNSKNNAKH